MPHSDLNSLLYAAQPRAVGGDGYWGPVTSSIDWCEENYIVSRIVAEFWNSLSNSGFIVLPLIGLFFCARTKPELRFWLSHLSIMMVGFGSFCFHSTLQHEAQLLDELPMMAATCLFTWIYLDMFRAKSSQLNAVILTLVGVLTSAAYLLLKEPVVFQILFGTLLVTQLSLGIRNVRRIVKEYPSESRVFWTMAVLSVSAIVLAFVLWNIDQAQCGALQSTRNSIGYPLRVALELHAWWHALSAYSAHTAIVGSEYSRALLRGNGDVELRWIAGFIPVVDLKRGNRGSASGSVKPPQPIRSKSKRA
ncbi:Alkaline ceramidase 3 [Geranomyces michiganensis]|nr:Alkaline ceramidase 3 [Geranomyces michiganensis]